MKILHHSFDNVLLGCKINVKNEATMELTKILHLSEFFELSQIDDFLKNKSKLFNFLNSNKEECESIIIALNDEELRDVVNNMFIHDLTVNVDAVDSNLYIHAIPIPITQYSTTKNTIIENAVFLNNFVSPLCCSEIKTTLSAHNVPIKCVPFLIPASSFADQKTSFTKKLIEAVKCDLCDFDNDNDGEQDKKALELINESGVTEQTLCFNHNSINFSVLLVLALSEDPQPPTLSQADLESIEDSIAYQYSTIIDGYTSVITSPSSPDFYNLIELCSSISSIIKNYDEIAPTIHLTIVNGEAFETQTVIQTRFEYTEILYNGSETKITNESFETKITNPYKMHPEYVLDEIKRTLLTIVPNADVVVN